jgi:hypothetical protein
VGLDRVGIIAWKSDTITLSYIEARPTSSGVLQRRRRPTRPYDIPHVYNTCYGKLLEREEATHGTTSLFSVSGVRFRSSFSKLTYDDQARPLLYIRRFSCL